ncbi:bifunctional oligoribonuclease/PAP phosphatase NrnA [Candidatus Margulisiibacteriota bacterium]
MKEAAAIKKAVLGAKTALVASHIDPDGDSIGSMLALGMILSGMGVTVDFFSHDGVPKIYRFLTGADKVRRVPRANRIYDILFAVDSSDLSRLGKVTSLHNISRTIINIDHHPDNTLYGGINYVEKVSCTAELIYKLAKHLNIKINRPIAENLYVALITDTGNFRYENTSVETFVMAGNLIRAGVNTHRISTQIYDTKSQASIRIQAAALSQMEISAEGKFAWVAVSEKMMKDAGAKSEDLIGLVDQIRSIEGVEVAVLFRQDHDRVKVNFRSKHKINVSEIAKQLGGGGHIRAAGAIISGKLDEVTKKVLPEIQKYLKAAKYLA